MCVCVWAGGGDVVGVVVMVHGVVWLEVEMVVVDVVVDEVVWMVVLLDEVVWVVVLLDEVVWMVVVD